MHTFIRGSTMILAAVLLSACWDDDSGTTPGEDDGTTVTIGAAGGEVSVDRLATVTFPQGSLNGADVTVKRQQSTEYAADFTETALLFGEVVQAPYQVSIDVEGDQPATDVGVSFTIPASVQALAPPGSELRIFYLLFQTSDMEAHRTVEVLPDRFPVTSTHAEVVLGPEAFAGEETDYEVHRAVLYVGFTPTASAASPLLGPVRSLAVAADECEGASLDYPVDPKTPVSSPFGLRTHPITGKWGGHGGVDFAAGDKTPVKAMADGVVESFTYQYNQKTKTGWGWHVVLKHDDGSRSLYAHLTDKSAVAKGTRVQAGEQIALSGASGGAKGAHLHVEYAPNGKIYDKPSKVNALTCMGLQTTGSVSVRDNGSAADDAFHVFLNGTKVCETSIGGSNNCSLGRLRTGNYTLGLLCVVAPDNLGTYEISLSNGLKFADGSTSKSDTMDEGEHIDFPLVAP